ncbi:MAG TPA: SURF1 family protein [Xanthomonadaceae bacterium]|nr:SURF1 family protein [Xanthomonadaceae bacterium]
MGPPGVSHARNVVFGWTAAIALAAGFVALGTWQLGRADQKAALLADAGAVLGAREPVPLSAAADPARADQLQWAAGRGRFADAGPFLLDNQRHDDRVGVRAYRVFVSDDETPGTALLVDLGWLPLGPGRAVPEVPRPAGVVDVRGLLASPPSPGLHLGPGIAPAGDAWLLTRVEPDVIAATAGLDRPLAPRVLRLDPALPIGHARDLEVLPNTLPPDRHLGYAVQWFALAATVLVVAGVLTLRARRRTPRPEPRP